MPAYEFVNKRHGLSVLVPCSVERRPRSITLRRVAVPSGVMVCSGARAPTIGDKLFAGYKAMDQAGKLSDKNPNYLPVKTIKKALAMPDAT